MRSLKYSLGFTKPSETVAKRLCLLSLLLSFATPDGKDLVYFNTNGDEIHRVESKSEFRTFIQSTTKIDHPTKSLDGWKEVPMPKIIVSKTNVNKKGVATEENTSGELYQKNDYIIAARTGLFNQTKNSGNLQLYTESGDAIPKAVAKLIPDLDPTFVKAIATQESNNGVSGVIDIMSSNNAGDEDKYKTAYGQNDKVTNVSNSLFYGIRFIATKGFRNGIGYDKETGNKTYTFKGWDKAAGNYNGGGTDGYEGYILKMKNGAINR